MTHEWVQCVQFKDGMLCAAGWMCNRCLAVRREKDELEDCLGEGVHYRLVTDADTAAPGILCISCGHISYHADDIEHRYCGHCNRFHDE
jgi:hypothetical protein